MPLRSATSASVSGSGRSRSSRSAISGPPAIFSMYTHGPGSNIVPRSDKSDHRERTRHPERRQARALERIDRDVDLGRGAVADLLAVEQHRGLVLLPLADHDDAVHRHRVEHVAHRVDGGLVGALLVAAPDHPRGRQRRRLGDAHQLEREVAVRPAGNLNAHRTAHSTPGGLRRPALSCERQTEPTRISSPPNSADPPADRDADLAGRRSRAVEHAAEDRQRQRDQRNHRRQLPARPRQRVPPEDDVGEDHRRDGGDQQHVAQRSTARPSRCTCCWGPCSC